MDVAHDVDTSGWWEVSTTVCMAGASMAEWRNANPEPAPGTLLALHLSDDYRTKEAAADG